MNCEFCEKELDGSYLSTCGRNRFCNKKCARGFSTKAKRQQINEIVSAKHRKNDGIPRRKGTGQLRSLLLKSGISHTCKECGLGSTWNGKELTLEVDHIDGNCYNNDILNLRFLCPNCHSQQPTNGWKNRRPHSLMDESTRLRSE